MKEKIITVIYMITLFAWAVITAPFWIGSIMLGINLNNYKFLAFGAVILNPLVALPALRECGGYEEFVNFIADWRL